VVLVGGDSRLDASCFHVGPHLGRPVDSLNTREVAQDGEHERIVHREAPLVQAGRGAVGNAVTKRRKGW